jgi:phage terminase large subunit-like protein
VHENETKRNEENLCSEETKLDHVVGKTTADETERGATDRLLAKVADLDRCKRSDDPPVNVEQAADGSLVWSGEPQEAEAGVLADCQALVDAGLGEWRENDQGEQ